MKKRQENNEKARKDMEKMGTSMKNPHFEEVSQIRKDWASSYKSIYEKMDPVGQEDGDIDNDGDKDSSDEYLMKRRKAIGKAMGKKGKCENCGGKGCEKCKDMKEGYGTGAAMIRGGGKPKKKVDVFAYDRKIGKKTTPDGKPLPPAPKNESVQFSEAELKAIQDKVDSWED